MFLTRFHGERPYQVEGLLSVAGVALLCWKGRLQSQGSNTAMVRYRLTLINHLARFAGQQMYALCAKQGQADCGFGMTLSKSIGLPSSVASSLPAGWCRTTPPPCNRR